MMVYIVCTSGDCCITFGLLDFVGVNFKKILKRRALLEEGVLRTWAFSRVNTIYSREAL